ncbi:IS110 family transposase [Marinobacterium arenosum]|uniref:IS110 family transposase n=1 Tax=Marinobacterium arenosum TaxID=2862496 RepID=UPI001C97C660|nr:IS110 family transposase [Marinobacterium arenosum]MBY4679161.1 IS110 family transposase [Marinobacterium arenosum]
MHVFIGIDVSKDKLDLCWLRDPTTNKKKSKVFKNRPAELANVCGWLLKNTGAEPQDILITVEPTGIYHEALIYHLHEQGFNIFLPNPAWVKSYLKSEGIVHKTDKSDATTLARYGLQKSNRQLWSPEAPEVRELKALMRRLDALEKDRQRELNRLEASTFNSISERVLQSLQEMIRNLDAEIKALQDDIDDHIDRHPGLKKNRELLSSIVGIGPVMSRELTYLLAAKDFISAKQTANYIGVIPVLQQSGKWVGHTRLSKEGPGRLRAKLYMAAVVAKQHNPLIQDQYERLLAAGKNRMQALGAAMRKLVHICFGVVKNQQEFQPQLP